MSFLKARIRQALTLVVVFILLIAVPTFVSSPYLLHIIILLFIYTVLATSWNMVGYYAGQLNLGHAAFFGFGGYTSALFYLSGSSPLLGIGLGGLTAGAFAVLVGFPTFRLRGVYFAVGTLALSEAMRVIFTNINAVGGASGLRLRALQGYDKAQYYYIALTILLISLLVIYWVLHSKTGLAFRAISRNEDAAESLGINPFAYKIRSLVISAILAGAIGGFYATYILFIEPSNVFNLLWTFNTIFAVIIGGGGTFFGPIVGSIVFVLISELTVGFGKMSSLIMGALLIAVIILFPQGIWGAIVNRVTGTGMGMNE